MEGVVATELKINRGACPSGNSGCDCQSSRDHRPHYIGPERDIERSHVVSRRRLSSLAMRADTAMHKVAETQVLSQLLVAAGAGGLDKGAQ